MITEVFNKVIIFKVTIKIYFYYLYSKVDVKFLNTFLPFFVSFDPFRMILTNATSSFNIFVMLFSHSAKTTEFI